MKKVFTLSLVLVLCAVLLTGCGGKTVEQLPLTVAADSIKDAVVAVAFSAGDFDAEKMTLSFEAFSKVFYDVVDVTEMKIGDTVVSPVSGKLVVKSIERDDAGGYILNGGAEQNGITLCSEGGGVFCQKLATDDHYAMQSVGKGSLPVSDNVTLFDDADLSSTGKTVSASELADYLAADSFTFNAHNTTVLAEGGVITEIHRVYMP